MRMLSLYERQPMLRCCRCGARSAASRIPSRRSDATAAMTFEAGRYRSRTSPTITPCAHCCTRLKRASSAGSIAEKVEAEMNRCETRGCFGVRAPIVSDNLDLDELELAPGRAQGNIERELGPLWKRPANWNQAPSAGLKRTLTMLDRA